MTIKQLEELGIYYVGTKIRPDRFTTDTIGEFKLNKPYSMEEILHIIYTTGLEDGVKEGKKYKIKEILNVLNLENDD